MKTRVGNPVTLMKNVTTFRGSAASVPFMVTFYWRLVGSNGGTAHAVAIGSASPWAFWPIDDDSEQAYIEFDTPPDHVYDGTTMAPQYSWEVVSALGGPGIYQVPDERITTVGGRTRIDVTGDKSIWEAEFAESPLTGLVTENTTGEPDRDNWDGIPPAPPNDGPGPGGGGGPGGDF